MPIQFTCPHCGAQTDVAEEYAGQSGPCAACGGPITVPPLAGTPGDFAPPKSSQTAIVVVVVMILVVAGAGLLICTGLLLWRSSARVSRSQIMLDPRGAACMNNLKQIGMAMHNYHAVHKCFPPAYIPDENGRPKHSWRVLLLPYLEQKILYDDYNFDEPWDGPNNSRLADAIGDVYNYRCPADWGDPSETSFVMIVGPGTISDGPTARKIEDITDGTSRTIMVVEVANSGIHWMEPGDLKAEDITFAINDGTPAGIRSEHPGGAHVLFCDTRVQFLPDSTDPAPIEAMSTIASGEDAGELPEDF
ncbi:MAG: DUF1559 domain-containing protein [Planctomycetota bacterium]